MTSAVPTALIPRGRVSYIDTLDSYQQMIERIASLEGPCAIDVERAHGYRYSTRAYLVQIKRGDEIFLIDPIRLGSRHREADLSALYEAIGHQTWIFHAGQYDLANLRALQMPIRTIFDSEISGRLLGFDKVNLASMVERCCGYHLEKRYSAVNWSVRPLKKSWLDYASLDVDFLIDMRSELLTQLEQSHRLEWAYQEFEWIVEKTSRPPRIDEESWRKLSGLHQLKSRRALAFAKGLWESRDRLALRLNKNPSRILSDHAIVDLAIGAADNPSSFSDLLEQIPAFSAPLARRYRQRWLSDLRRLDTLPSYRWPQRHRPRVPIPKSVRSWKQVNPQAALHWEKICPAIDELACDLGIERSLLISPAAFKDFVWNFDRLNDRTSQEEHLQRLDVRPWQRDLLIETIASISL